MLLTLLYHRPTEIRTFAKTCVLRFPILRPWRLLCIIVIKVYIAIEAKVLDHPLIVHSAAVGRSTPHISAQKVTLIQHCISGQLSAILEIFENYGLCKKLSQYKCHYFTLSTFQEHLDILQKVPNCLRDSNWSRVKVRIFMSRDWNH